MSFLIPTKNFKSYYRLVFTGYLLYGFIAYVSVAILSFVLSRYIHWTLALIITLIINIVEFFSIRFMRKKIPENSILHSIINLIPGMKYVHMYAIDKFKVVSNNK